MVERSKRLKRTKPRQGEIYLPILIIVIILFFIGLLFVLSSSWPEAVNKASETDKFPGYAFVRRQFIFGIIGIVSMIFFINFDYNNFKKYHIDILGYIITCMLGLSILLVPSIAKSEYGATRWISVAGVRFMPSDLMKIGVIIFIASFLSNRERFIRSFSKTSFFAMLIAAIPLAIIIKNDLGTSIVLAGTIGTMFIVSGVNLFHFVPILSLIPLAYKFLFQGEGSFRSGRIDAWLNPFDMIQDEGWQIAHSLLALGTGGIRGLGIGLSRQKYNYIPFPYNDYIFSIIGEEAGLAGTTIVLLLFCILVFLGYRVAFKCKDLFGKYLAVGLTSLIGIQAFINIAVSTNTIPSTGITLPFISYGGTSLVVVFTCIGILLNVSRNCKE